jgi:excisionase family DNA binding protein
VRRSLLTTRSAADTAACDVVTIRRAIQAGELRALRLGHHGDYRIPAEALEEWLRPAQPQKPKPTS